MTGILKVDTIRNTAGTVSLPTTALQSRLVQRWSRWWRGGLWNPGNTWYEIPGSYVSITPLYSNSFLRYTYMLPLGHRQNAHSISHLIFMANGQEYARHSSSATHQGSMHAHRWEVPSWGAGKSGNMGYISRQYSDGSHSVHFNGRRYFEGADTSPAVPSYVLVEEYLPAP